MRLSLMLFVLLASIAGIATAQNGAIASIPRLERTEVSGDFIFTAADVTARDLDLPTGTYAVHVYTNGDSRLGGSGVKFAGLPFTTATFDGNLGSIRGGAFQISSTLNSPPALSGASSIVGRTVVIVPDMLKVEVARLSTCNRNAAIRVEVWSGGSSETQTASASTRSTLTFDLGLTPGLIGENAVPADITISVTGGGCDISLGTTESAPTGLFPTVYVTEGKPCPENQCAEAADEENYVVFGNVFGLENMGILQPVSAGDLGNADGIHMIEVPTDQTNGETGGMKMIKVEHGDFGFTELSGAATSTISTQPFHAAAAATIGISRMDNNGASGAPGQTKLICTFVPTETSRGGDIQGSVLVTKEASSPVAIVEARVAGLNPGTSHSFHFHTYGDISDYDPSLPNNANWGPVFSGGSATQIALDLLELASSRAVATYMSEFTVTNIDDFSGRSMTIHDGPEYADPTIAWGVCGQADSEACLFSTCPDIVAPPSDGDATSERESNAMGGGWSRTSSFLFTILMCIIGTALLCACCFGCMYLLNQMDDEDSDDESDDDDDGSDAEIEMSKVKKKRNKGAGVMDAPEAKDVEDGIEVDKVEVGMVGEDETVPVAVAMDADDDDTRMNV